MPERIESFLFGTRSRAIVCAAICFALISGADYLLRNEITIDVFYFVPILIVTWHGGRGWGGVFSLAAVLTWLTDEHLFVPGFLAQLHIIAWNAAVRLAFFMTVVLLLAEIRKLLGRERAVSKLKSAMMHTVSHEFNNALTGLSTGLFLLRETDAAAQESTRAQLYTAMEASQHKLSMYVKNILNEARMEEGRFRIDKKPVALREILSGAAESLSEVLKQKGVILLLDLPERPLVVNADREALALVISNLLGNAAKYTRSGGTITVRIEPGGTPPASAVFSVEDTGIGISLADLNKITSGFYRTEEGREQADGFGLGLKISNELLALHGSRLEISSEKGQGSRFFFELPLFQEGPGDFSRQCPLLYNK
ncbi:MAG: HAMP domain-containing sensor histidine kinase [Elusimicrobiales bacterium]|nr:HAMP domain-containing sensor histidine kinase [Elusimicrobiales bacterium]